MDYCQLSDAMKHIAFMSVTSTSNPSTAQANDIVSDISAELSGILMGNGWTLPLAEPQLLSYLKAVASYGAAARILGSRIGSFGPEAAQVLDQLQRSYREGKQLLASKNFAPSVYNETDAHPFGDGFPSGDSSDMDDPDNPWVTRSTEF